MPCLYLEIFLVTAWNSYCNNSWILVKAWSWSFVYPIFLLKLSLIIYETEMVCSFCCTILFYMWNAYDQLCWSIDCHSQHTHLPCSLKFVFFVQWLVPACMFWKCILLAICWMPTTLLSDLILNTGKIMYASIICVHFSKSASNLPKGIKKILVHLVFDIKHDGWHKSIWLMSSRISLIAKSVN